MAELGRKPKANKPVPELGEDKAKGPGHFDCAAGFEELRRMQRCRDAESSGTYSGCRRVKVKGRLKGISAAELENM